MNEFSTKTETFDVFLCHNSEDKPEIRIIVRQLTENGIKPWLDEDQIQPGELWQIALGEQINNIKSAAVFVGESGLGPWQQEELQSFLSEFVERKCRVIPVILSSSTETPALPWPLKNRHMVDFRFANPDPLKQLIWGITGDKPDEQLIDSLPLVSNTPERQYPAIVSPPEGEQRTQLLILLDRVKEYWVDGVLKQSLFNEVMISLGKSTKDQAVIPPWKHFGEFPNQHCHLKAQDRNINSIFNATGLLLILGEPGSGKTTTLLELASDLIERVISDSKERVPIVFNLSSWTKKQSLDEWIVGELSAKYRVPKKIGSSWLKNDYLLPLLDDLDEVPNALMPACVSAINEFITKFEFTDKIGPSGLVVCCRRMEYQWLPERLKLNGAICLELLGVDEVSEFLTSAGEQLAGLQRAMSIDPVLQELAQTPLMLSIMSLAYEGVGADDLSNQKAGSHKERREQIFNLYVDRMFQRKQLINNPFSKDKVIRWLAQLARGMKAHSQSVFMVEKLQPSWITSIGQQAAYGTITALIIAFIALLIAGLTEGLIGGSAEELIGELIEGLFDALTVLVGIGLGCWPKSFLRRSSMSALIAWLLAWLIYGLSDGLMEGLETALFAGLIVGFSCGFGVGSLKVIGLVETLQWQWKKFWRKAIPGFFIGLIIGGLFLPLTVVLEEGLSDWQSEELIVELISLLFVSLFFGMIAGLIVGTVSGLLGGITDTVKEDKASPNQGINLSLKNAVLSTLIIGLIVCLIPGLIVGSIGEARDTLIDGLIFGVIFGLIFGLIGGLNRGGSAVIKHYSLRLILWIKGYTPFKFIKFLDYSAKLILLKKVGGGYIFIHRMLLEHFAKMELKSTQSKKSK